MPRNEEAGPRHRDRPSHAARTGADNITAASVGRSGRSWSAGWGPMSVQARTAAQERRARVLAHPDLAELLTAAPLGFARPGQWNGYVPPDSWRERRNDSPRRAALVALCAEALRREGGEDVSTAGTSSAARTEGCRAWG